MSWPRLDLPVRVGSFVGPIFPNTVDSGREILTWFLLQITQPDQADDVFADQESPDEGSPDGLVSLYRVGLGSETSAICILNGRVLLPR